MAGAAPVEADAAARDDTEIIALDLPPEPPTPAIEAYFAKCEEKLGFVPNVLKAYGFAMPKLEAFAAMYNDLMLAPSGLSKLEREMVAVAVSSHNR
ncbi:MAG TPA: alkylhydroperoxidase, partial [Xanthobacteraceae bacterium]|nr:alkylhydroperoxidase [Xanthobacteraceae bacterium]